MSIFPVFMFQLPPNLKPPHHLETVGETRPFSNYAARREFDQFQPLPVGIQTGLLDRIRHTPTAQWCVLRCWWKTSSMIVLLDLSAAFDTIDIDTPLRRLEHTFGITGSALLWLKTYLEDRSQYVRIGNDRSSVVSCEFGVPQGSVLGPALFSAYVAPIAGVISSFGVHHTQYADDTQLYIELQKDATETLDSCFQAVHRWFTENGLALNPDKSEAIVIGTGARTRQEGRIDAMTLGSASITVSDSVKSWASPLMRLFPSTPTSTTSARHPTSTSGHCDIYANA